MLGLETYQIAWIILCQKARKLSKINKLIPKRHRNLPKNLPLKLLLAKVVTLKIIINLPVNLNTFNLFKSRDSPMMNKRKKNYIKFWKEDEGTRIYYC